MKIGLVLFCIEHFTETAILQQQEMHHMTLLRPLDEHNTHSRPHIQPLISTTPLGKVPDYSSAFPGEL